MTRRVTSLDVECPTCHAQVGSRCYHLDGTGPTSPHPRRRSHAREENEHLHPVQCAGQLPLPGVS